MANLRSQNLWHSRIVLTRKKLIEVALLLKAINKEVGRCRWKRSAKVHASDLNPVAVLINKVMIESSPAAGRLTRRAGLGACAVEHFSECSVGLSRRKKRYLVEQVGIMFVNERLSPSKVVHYRREIFYGAGS